MVGYLPFRLYSLQTNMLMDRSKFLQTSALASLGVGLLTAQSCKKKEEEAAIDCGDTNACVTKCDAEGPFFKSVTNNNTDLTQMGPGDAATYSNTVTKMRSAGRVCSGDDCNQPVADAIINIWHADPDGHYDVKESSPGAGDAVPDTAVQINFRTVLRTNANGEYSFITYQPFGYYNRPQHIHVKVDASGHRQLTTQLYFEGDPKLVPGNFSDGISQSEADAIDADRRVVLSNSSSTEVDQEGQFDVRIQRA